MPDVMEIEILDDGTIKVETSKVSMPNHLNAEQFLRETAKAAGGTVTRTRKGHAHHHHHHGHEAHQH